MKPLESNPRPLLVITCVGLALVFAIYLVTRPLTPSRDGSQAVDQLPGSTTPNESTPLAIEAHEKLWAAQNRAATAHADRFAPGLFKQAEAASIKENFADAERLYLQAADLAEKVQATETAKTAYDNASKRIEFDLLKRHSLDAWRKIEVQLARTKTDQANYTAVAAGYTEAIAILNDAYPKAALLEARHRIATKRHNEALDLLASIICDNPSHELPKAEFDAIAANTSAWWVRQAEKAATAEQGSYTHKAYASCAIASVYFLSGDKALYQEHMQQAIRAAKAVTVPDDFIASFIKVGDYQRDLGDKEGARRSLELAATGVETAQAQSFWYSLLAGKALRLADDDLWNRFDAHLHPLRSWERPILLCRAYAFGGFPEKAWPDATNYCFFAPIAFFAAEKGDEDLYRKARMATLQDIPKWPKDSDSAWAYTTIASADA